MTGGVTGSRGVTTRVLIVAVSPVVRAGLEAVLARGGSVAVVGAVAPGGALAEEIEAREPHVVVMDLEAAGDAPAPLASPAPVALTPDGAPRAPAFVLLADAPSAAWVGEVLRAGVRAVLPRAATPDEIAAAVDAAGAGLVAVPSEVAGALLAQAARTASRRPPSAPTQPLTRREVEVLGMLAEGLGNKIIAARLGISEHTVKAHVGAVFSKLGADTRAEAVAIGIRLGLIML